MDIEPNLEFDHSNIDLIELGSRGIKSPKELEDVILGESYWKEESESFWIATGFTRNTHA